MVSPSFQSVAPNCGDDTRELIHTIYATTDTTLSDNAREFIRHETHQVRFGGLINLFFFLTNCKFIFFVPSALGVNTKDVGKFRCG